MEGRCQHGGHGTKIQKYNLSNQHQEIRPSKSNSNFKKVWKTFYLGRVFFRHFKSVLTDSCPQTDEPLMFDIGWVFIHGKVLSYLPTESRVFSLYCTEKPHLKSQTKLIERVKYKKARLRANFPFSLKVCTNITMGRKGLSEKTCFIITIRDGFRKSSLLKALKHFRWLLAAFHKTQVVYIWAREKSLPRMKSPHFTARKKPKCNPKPNHCLRFIESVCRSQR